MSRGGLEIPLPDESLQLDGDHQHSVCMCGFLFFSILSRYRPVSLSFCHAKTRVRPPAAERAKRYARAHANRYRRVRVPPRPHASALRPSGPQTRAARDDFTGKYTVGYVHN